jgi:prophage tail gpP-like protein
MADNPDDDEVKLVVNGTRYEGWKTVHYHESISELSPVFRIGYADKWTELGEELPIEDGDRVELFFGADKLLTGFVDETDEEYDERNHTLEVCGRARTCDLVDCSAIYKKGLIRGKSFREIAALLCKPFGISVSLSGSNVDVDVVIPVFKIEDGDTVFDVLNGLARNVGSLLQTDADGDLVITRAATQPLPNAQIRSVENIKRGRLRKSSRDRYSNYIFKGQAAGTDNHNGKVSTQIKHVVSDDEVRRYRPLLVVELHSSMKRRERRAIWERNTRGGRGFMPMYNLRGWRNVQGLWRVNTIVRVIDDRLGIDDDMLVACVDLTRSLREGCVAQITVAPKEMYDVLKPPRRPKHKRGKHRRNRALERALGGR